MRFGSFESFVPQSAGLALGPESIAVVATSAGGALGCALVSDESAAPGTNASVVVAKIDPREVADRRCPDGIHAIVDDAARCVPSWNELPEGCAGYRSWDASGEQVAQLPAIGGYVAVTETRVTDELTTCDVELSVRFDGGHVVEKSFRFEFSPFTSDDVFCVH